MYTGKTGGGEWWLMDFISVIEGLQQSCSPSSRENSKALAFGDGTWPDGRLPSSGKALNMGKMELFFHLGLGSGCKDILGDF